MAGWKGMSRRFRDMLKSGRTFVQPGVFNAQSAQIAEKAGFETVGVSGYSLSATLIGKPDVGLTTLTEVAQLTGYICDAVNIPVLADADTGYGNAINAMRTVYFIVHHQPRGLMKPSMKKFFSPIVTGSTTSWSSGGCNV